MTERAMRRSVTGAVLVLISVLSVNAVAGQSAPDTLPWITRTRSFRATGCTKPDWPACSSVELAWPEFTSRPSARAQVNRVLLPSLVIGEQPVPRRRNIAQVANEFLRAGRSSSADGMHWDAKRTISVLCNTPTRVLLQADEYTFTGGAHGNPSTQLLAFEPASGRIVGDRTMVPMTARPQLLLTVERAFRRERELPPTGSLADSGYTFRNDSFSLDAASLAVCGSSLFVYWNVYDIGPYSAGAPRLVIPLDSVPMLRQ